MVPAGLGCGDGGVRLTRVPICTRAFGQLDAPTLYAILQLRAQVFVVEQDCAYLDPDGRDTEAATRHCWIASPDGGIAAYLRITAEPGGEHRIGRVVVAPRARGQGLAGELVRQAVALVPGPLVLDAQSHLTGLYARHGFVQAGEEFVEDGIPHVPMRRPG